MARMTRGWPIETTVRHGTPSGWSMHSQLNERPCDACFRAKSDYDKRRRLAPGATQQNRLRAAARLAALGRLAKMYPEDFAPLFAEEKAARGLPS